MVDPVLLDGAFEYEWRVGKCLRKEIKWDKDFQNYCRSKSINLCAKGL